MCTCLCICHACSQVMHVYCVKIHPMYMYTHMWVSCTYCPYKLCVLICMLYYTYVWLKHIHTLHCTYVFMHMYITMFMCIYVTGLCVYIDIFLAVLYLYLYVLACMSIGVLHIEHVCIGYVCIHRCPLCMHVMCIHSKLSHLLLKCGLQLPIPSSSSDYV